MPRGRVRQRLRCQKETEAADRFWEESVRYRVYQSISRTGRQSKNAQTIPDCSLASRRDRLRIVSENGVGIKAQRNAQRERLRIVQATSQLMKNLL